MMSILNIYRRVIWDPMGIFVVKQGVIMIHWGSVGFTEGSVGLNGESPELSGGQCDSLWLNEAQ